MTNPNTDTVEAVALLAQNLMSRHLQITEGEIEGTGPASYAIARAIAAMPGNGEAMREAAASKAEDYGDRNCPGDGDDDQEYARNRTKQEAGYEIAAAIRALPLPLPAVPVKKATPTSDEIQAWIKLAYREPADTAKLDAFRFTRWNMEVAYRAGFDFAAAPLPPAEPYAWLCTSPELDPVIVYGRENAETYAAQPERWTVEALYRGPKFAPPLPPAQEG